jgi:hypothetical protein
VKSGGATQAAHVLPARAAKPCLSQDWPICSRRPSFKRNMFWAITGWSPVNWNQLSQHDPRLHESVPMA